MSSWVLPEPIYGSMPICSGPYILCRHELREHFERLTGTSTSQFLDMGSGCGKLVAQDPRVRKKEASIITYVTFWGSL